jgi:hypothetical protein
MSLEEQLDDKPNPIVDSDQADIEGYDPHRDGTKFGTKNDQHDMYRLGKDQKFRVSGQLLKRILRTHKNSEILGSFQYLDFL